MSRKRHRADLASSPSSRPRRVGEAIRRELAPPLQRIASDFDLGMVTLTSVDVSSDLRNAKLFVTQIGAPVTHADLIGVLSQMAGELRNHLAHNLRLRTVPRLSFHFDESVERGARLSALLDSVATEHAPDDGGTASDHDHDPRRDTE
jgi:ribosome-binding factor A